MNRISLLLTALMLPLFALAQSGISRNSTRLGVDLATLDAPDDVGLRLTGRLARHLGNDRVVVALEAGYMRIRSANLLFNEVDPGPDRRERYTVDLTAFYDFLKTPRHALRVGAGMSAWYQRDDIYRGASAQFSPNGLQVVAIDRTMRNTLNTGVHFATEYEWLFDQRWGVDVRLRIANLEGAGISSMLGAGISRRF